MKLKSQVSTSILLAWVFGNSSITFAATAFCHFTTDDGSFLNAEAADSMAELVQIALQDQDDIQWVDRQDIDQVLEELVRQGLVTGDTAAPLQVGKWLRADLLIKGTFTASADNAWKIHLEIIELQRADILKQSEIVLEEQAPPKLEVSDRLVAQIAAQLRVMLPNAISKRDRATQQSLVAPLHFQNTHQNGRLDFFESELQQAFSTRNEQQNEYRYLQFPKTEDAIAEAVLSETGLTDVPENSQLRIANHYVWGEYSESNSSGVPFDQVTIEFSVSHWNGGDKHDQKTFRGTVGNRAELIAQIVAHVESITSDRRRTSIDDNARQQVARSFYERAMSRRIDTIQVDMRDASHATERWIRIWRQAKRLLSLAVFFDPTNEDIRREFLLENVRTDLPQNALPGVSELWKLRDQYAFWSQYAMSFDLNYELPRANVFKERPGSTTDNRLFYGHFAMARMEVTRKLLSGVATAIVEAVERGDDSDEQELEYRTDVPARVLRKWQAQLAPAFLSQLEVVAQHNVEALKHQAFWLIYRMDFLPTSESKAKMLKLVWPVAARNPKFDGQKFRKAIEQVYNDLRTPEVAEAMLNSAATGAPAKAEMRRVQKRSKAKPSLELEPLAETRSAPMEAFSVEKWWSLQEVTALTYAGNRLWCAFEGQRMDQDLTPGNALFSHDTRAAKWQTWKGVNRHETRVSCLLQVDGHLWVSFVGDDICRMNLESGRTHRFTSDEGVPSQELYDICQSGRTVFVGGGGASEGVLGSYDLRKNQWTQYELNSVVNHGKELPCPCIKKVAANENWVAAFAEYYGLISQIFVHDRTNMKAVIDAGRIIKKSHPEFSHFGSSWRPRVAGMLWIDNLLWIATSRGILVFDPALQKVVYAQPIKYELTSMVLAGDHLWFGACPFRGNGTLGATDEHTSVLLFDVASKTWLAQIPVPYPGHLNTICRYEDTLWIAPGKGKATVVAVDISSFANNGKAD